jgi:hypothetical protein
VDEIELTTNGRSVLVLESRGSAGYRWNFTIDDPRLLAVERILAPTDATPRLPGESPGERFELMALGAGETVVRFAQSRAFGPPKAPLATHEIRVKIREP